MVTITRHEYTFDDKTVSYLDAGPKDGTLIVLVHGWPEFAEIWKPQIIPFAALGFRVVAPDCPGYGESFKSRNKVDYSLERINATFLALLAHLERDQAIWIGHDWGATLVWSFVAHYPQNTIGAVTMCVPYRTLEFGIEEGLVKYCDRSVYPEAEFPNAQWDYQAYYQNPETYEKAIKDYQIDIPAFMRMIYQKGDPSGKGKPAFTSYITRNNGWFFGGDKPFDLPLDTDVLDEETYNSLVKSFEKGGFWDPTAYYLNHDINNKYTKEKSANGGVIEFPALFIEATYDWICEVADSKLAEPMREYCRNLTEVTIDASHWVAQEKAKETNAAIIKWIATALPPEVWPYAKTNPLKKVK